MKRKRAKAFLPIVLLFLILNAFFIVGKNLLQSWEADQDVLIAGNVLLFLITLISFLLANRGLANPNPHAFVRAVYGSIMIKLLICLGAAFIYIITYKKDLNKPALFIVLGLYLLYTFIEVSVLLKLLKKSPNE